MLVVDGGKEFRSRYFEALVNSYSGSRNTVPGPNPAMGPLLSGFWDYEYRIVLNSLGNTQASKVPRQMTKAVNPKNQAAWELPERYDFLCEWAYEVYDQQTHPALGQSPARRGRAGWCLLVNGNIGVLRMMTPSGLQRCPVRREKQRSSTAITAFSSTSVVLE